MALPLEETIMNEIGLGAHYSWFNGSGSCEYICRDAVNKLSATLQKHGMTLDPKWLALCREANLVDQVNSGQYGLTNTWIVCSYAIEDAIYRQQGGEGAGILPDNHHWQFWSEKEKQQWERQQSNKYRFDFINRYGDK